ncbi:hypothetical protein CR513_46412, partial [Mucuna pruriens]
MKTREKEEEEALEGNESMIVNSVKGKAYEKEENAMSMWDCGSPLYDSYELVSFDHIIDRHLMEFPSSNGSPKPIITRFTHHSIKTHDMVPHKVASNKDKSKGFFVVANLSKFSVKIMRKKRKNNEESLQRGKKNKELRRGFAGAIIFIQ